MRSQLLNHLVLLAKVAKKLILGHRCLYLALVHFDAFEMKPIFAQITADHCFIVFPCSFLAETIKFLVDQGVVFYIWRRLLICISLLLIFNRHWRALLRKIAKLVKTFFHLNLVRKSTYKTLRQNLRI